MKHKKKPQIATAKMPLFLKVIIPRDFAQRVGAANDRGFHAAPTSKKAAKKPQRFAVAATKWQPLLSPPPQWKATGGHWQPLAVIGAWSAEGPAEPSPRPPLSRRAPSFFFFFFYYYYYCMTRLVNHQPWKTAVVPWFDHYKS